MLVKHSKTLHLVGKAVQTFWLTSTMFIKLAKKWLQADASIPKRHANLLKARLTILFIAKVNLMPISWHFYTFHPPAAPFLRSPCQANAWRNPSSAATDPGPWPWHCWWVCSMFQHTSCPYRELPCLHTINVASFFNSYIYIFCLAAKDQILVNICKYVQ